MTVDFLISSSIASALFYFRLSSSLDEIILGYIVGILDELAQDDCSDFDVDDFVEMISPYCPGVAGLPQVRVSTWVRDLATERKAPKGQQLLSFI
jgi:hypothetical protein